MKKTVQTTAWQFSKQLLAIACFLVIGMVQVAAQTTTNYVVSISVRNMSWELSWLAWWIEQWRFRLCGRREFLFSARRWNARCW
jgi:hypothetical protein